jgi:hypothetical protein
MEQTRRQFLRKNSQELCPLGPTGYLRYLRARGIVLGAGSAEFELEGLR